MGLFDILTGPTEARLAKKKEKKKEPETPASVAKGAPPAPPAAVAQTRPSAPAQDYGPVIERSRPVNTPLQFDLSKLFGDGGGKPVDPQEVMETMRQLGILGKQQSDAKLPDFKIDDLMERSDELQKIMASGMPYDVRPLAAYMDTVFGTDSYKKTPNQPAEFMDNLKAFKELGGDSKALQQVKGQARLEEYKTQLHDYEKKMGIMSPLELAKAYEAVAKGGSSGAGSAGSNLRTALQIATNQNQESDRVQKENAEIDRQMQKDATELGEKFSKDPAVTDYISVRDSARRVRSTIYTPPMNKGIPDYSLVLEYITGLDPHSTVMYNEAQAFGKAQGLIEQMKNLYTGSFLQGGKIGDDAKQAMLYLIGKYEEIQRQSYEGAKKFYGSTAARSGLQPDIVVGPTKQRVEIPDRIFTIQTSDGKQYRVKEKAVERFKEAHKNLKPVVIGGGH